MLRLVVAGCHHDGRLRQAAIPRPSALDHPAAVAVVALRTSDWVPQVRDTARPASERWLSPATDPTLLTTMMRLAFTLRARWHGDWLADLVERAPPGLPPRRSSSRCCRPPTATPGGRPTAIASAIASGRMDVQRLMTAAAEDADVPIRTMCARAVIATADETTIRPSTTAG